MKKLILLLYIICTLIISGCSGVFGEYRDVADLQLIQTLALDRDQGLFRLGISSESSSDVKGTDLARYGESVSAAIRALQGFAGAGDLYYSHIRYMVLGQTAAEAGLSPALDLIERASQIRLDIGLFVIQGDTAETLLKRSGEGTDVTELLSGLERTGDRTGESHVFTARDVSRSLLERNCAMISALRLVPTQGSVFTETGEITAVPSGYALIKGDKLSGFLNGDQARALALLTEQGELGELTVSVGRQVSLDVRSAGCKFIPVWEGGKIKTLEIKMSLSAAIGELSHALPRLTEADYAAIEEAASDKISSWIRAVLEMQREHEADYLGLMGRVRRACPREFAPAEDQWPAALADTEYLIKVECPIKRDYDLHAPER